jgi:hypothetical protein
MPVNAKSRGFSHYQRWLMSSRWSNSNKPAKLLGLSDDELELVRGAMRLVKCSTPNLKDSELAGSILLEIDEAERRSAVQG